MPNNPNVANNVVAYPGSTDTSNNESLTGGGAGYWGTGESILVTSNSHPVVSRADGALWDTTAGAYVSIQNTNIGTTAVPKNGQ